MPNAQPTLDELATADEVVASSGVSMDMVLAANDNSDARTATTFRFAPVAPTAIPPDKVNAVMAAIRNQGADTPRTIEDVISTQRRKAVQAIQYASSVADAQAQTAHGGDWASETISDEEKKQATERQKKFDADFIIEDAADFMQKRLPEFDWIVPNLIARVGDEGGTKGDLYGKSKTMKTFCALQLAHCVAAGKKFLSWDIPQPRKVLYINLELFPTGEQDRMKAQQSALGINPEELRERLLLLNLRGRGHELRNYAKEIAIMLISRNIDLVIIDPRYKLVEDGEDENTAVGLRGILNFRDAISAVCAVLVVGHDPKGDVGEKSIADRGAGSYTAGADYDFCLALSPHETDGLTVLSASSRYRPSPDDMTLSFDPKTQVFTWERDIVAVKKSLRRKSGSESVDSAVKKIVDSLKAKPNYRNGLEGDGFNLSSPTGRVAWKKVTENPSAFGLAAVVAEGTKMIFYGLPEQVKKAADEAATNLRNCRNSQK